MFSKLALWSLGSSPFHFPQHRAPVLWNRKPRFEQGVLHMAAHLPSIRIHLLKNPCKWVVKGRLIQHWKRFKTETNKHDAVENIEKKQQKHVISIYFLSFDNFMVSISRRIAQDDGVHGVLNVVCGPVGSFGSPILANWGPEQLQNYCLSCFAAVSRVVWWWPPCITTTATMTITTTATANT